MRLILMGTGPFAVPTFRALFNSNHAVALVVARPPVARRGRRSIPVSPVIELAGEFNVPLCTPADVNDATFAAELQRHHADLMVVCDYGQILARGTLALTQLGGVNLHGSLLPRYRGAAPVNWALFHGDTETGVSVIHMTPQLDGGPILAARRTPIAPDEDAEQLEQRLADLGVAAVDDALRTLESWDRQAAIGTPQDQSQATRARRLRKSDGAIDWRRRAMALANQVRALKPWPGTYTQWSRSGKPVRLIIERVQLVADPAPVGDGSPGTIVRVDKTHLWIATGDGILALMAVKPAGKRVLDTAEFLRGYPLHVGDMLGDG